MKLVENKAGFSCVFDGARLPDGMWLMPGGEVRCPHCNIPYRAWAGRVVRRSSDVVTHRRQSTRRDGVYHRVYEVEIERESRRQVLRWAMPGREESVVIRVRDTVVFLEAATSKGTFVVAAGVTDPWEVVCWRPDWTTSLEAAIEVMPGAFVLAFVVMIWVDDWTLSWLRVVHACIASCVVGALAATGSRPGPGQFAAVE